MVDTGKKHSLTPDWKKTERFTLPGVTKVVIIKGRNNHGKGAILASFSNGVVTDGAWQCANMGSCTINECDNSETWQNATTYGVNGDKPSPWNAKMKYIESTAHWIWVDNPSAESVWCKKTFGKSHTLLIATLLKFRNCGNISFD